MDVCEAKPIAAQRIMLKRSVRTIGLDLQTLIPIFRVDASVYMATANLPSVAGNFSGVIFAEFEA